MQAAMASAERIFMLLDSRELEPEPENLLFSQGQEGRLSLRTYGSVHDNDWVLKDVSFRIEPGETCAFVGHTGQERPPSSA